MVLSCFRAAGGVRVPVDLDEAPRPSKPQTTHPNGGAKRSSRMIRRHGSADSHSTRSSTGSNDSISKLPPCSGTGDPKVEALMMPLPPEPRPSRCLRLSQPKTYSNIIDGMKACKGCRDWRSFAVFYADDIDLNVSADAIAKKRAADYERKLRQLNSFSSDDGSLDLDVVLTE